MKLFHLSDLHLGKIVNGFSMLKEQEHILEQVIDKSIKEKIDGIIIAGDIYDKTIPSVEAINLFDEFITKYSSLNIPMFIVSGNHDSVQRVSYGADIMAKNKIYFAKSYNGSLEAIKLNDKINIYLLPFVRPADIRPYHSDNIEIGSYNDAIKVVVDNVKLDKNKINILVAHQFVTNNGKNPLRSDSENASLGTLDNIDTSVFKDFDYVALGHIHNPQNMAHNIRYSGSPLKYSFSEVNQKKSITVLDIEDEVKISQIPFCSSKDLKEIKGSFDEVMKNKSDNYMHITLTDDYIPDIKNKLEINYPNIMVLDYDNVSTKENKKIKKVDIVKKKSLVEHFRDFYEIQNNVELDEKQEKIVDSLAQDLKDEV